MKGEYALVNTYFFVILVMSLVSVICYGVDKINSLQDGRVRIPETVLLTLSALGGNLGTILGMIFFNHKSNMSHKWYFFVTIVISFLIQFALLPICFVIF